MLILVLGIFLVFAIPIFAFEVVDIIFGLSCSCPSPSFESDPVTGKKSEVKIYSIFTDIEKYRKTIEAEVTAEYVWDFLGSGWNYTDGNPEGASPELG